ncbi:FadR/GntR family transcriptional regulator [Pelagibius sp. Alg239-R121]|uniref:FadR/GntR family transcriptional regulator n=1 Tax=Pelagibius sp. Alg239-R121 TaxID=2993448 RepID=UPI0024A64612|nr:FadR/GntR family transcriptional regulator [Pelagibius sp. Alg239-R121]
MSEMIYYDLKQVAGLAPSLATHMARELGRRIVAGGYEPGRLVEDEAALAERYQVSRSVVRDAVKILVGKGLLEVRRGIGTRVRPRDSWGLLDNDVLAWYQSAPPSGEILRQLMDVRRVFEPKAALWAAERATPDDLAMIETAIERMEDEKGSVEDFVVADALFHRSILRAAQNEFLSAMEGIIFSALLSSIRLTNKDPRENQDSIPFHREVYEAIAAGDGERAERVMERLLGDAGNRLGDRLNENQPDKAL